MARRHFSFAILLIGLALAGGAYAADSSSPSPPTTSNTNQKPPPATPYEFNSTNGQDYSDYEVPMNLAPDGIEVVQDYVPISQNADKEDDELAQPQGESDKKTNHPKDSASSSSSSSSFVLFVVAAGLFLF